MSAKSIKRALRTAALAAMLTAVLLLSSGCLTIEIGGAAGGVGGGVHGGF
jgi:hypothetical protein